MVKGAGDPPSQYTPTSGAPTVRAVVLLSRVACPRCGRLQFQTTPRHGEAWMTCEVRRCRQDFLVITFPERVDGLAVLGLVGEPLARDLIHSLSPEHAALEPPELYMRPLLEGRARAHLIIGVSGRERHLHRDEDTRIVLGILQLVG